MEFLNNLISQLSEVIRGQSPVRKLILLAIVAGSISGLIWLTVHANTSTKVVLFGDMDPMEAGEAVLKLRTQNIEVEMADGGTTLKVERNRSAEAMMLLSMEGIPNSGTVGFELMDRSSIGQSKFQQEKNYLRMREGEISRTLQSIREIERARVHLSIPEHSLFVQDEQLPKAAVKLTLRSGTRLSQRQINGIIHMVSHSVEGLAPEGVSIIDQMGNLINLAGNDQNDDGTSGQQTFKTQYEDLLKSRIESMLEKVVGRARVAARVQADFDFSTRHEVKEIFNPENSKPVINNEQILIDGKATMARDGVQGVPGSTSNLPLEENAQEPAESANNAQPEYREDRTTDYAVSRLVQESEKNMPTPVRMTVAVVVDGKYEDVTTGEGKTVSEFMPRSKEELKQLEDLVKSTIGYDDERNDLVTVACVPFMIEDLQEEPSLLDQYDRQQLIEMIIKWTVVGLIGLFLILMVLRPAVRQIIVTPQPAAALPAGTAGALGESGAGQIAMGGKGSGDEDEDGQEMLDEMSPEQELADFKKALTPEAREALRKSGSGENIDEVLRLAEAAYARSSGSGDAKNRTDEIAGRSHVMHLMARQAKISQAAAQKIHDEVVSTAKGDPNKTVSLLRQWMEEA